MLRTLAILFKTLFTGFWAFWERRSLHKTIDTLQEEKHADTVADAEHFKEVTEAVLHEQPDANFNAIRERLSARAKRNAAKAPPERG